MCTNPFVWDKVQKKMRFDLKAKDVDDLTWLKAHGEIGYRTGRWTLIPCGQCTQCRINYSKQWAIRQCLETQYHDKETNWFLTLTYDQEHVPLAPQIVDIETGELLEALYTCRISDVVAFNKRLREHQARKHNNADGIKFYGVSEYGSHTLRPHYHVNYMGLVIDDFRHWSSREGIEYFVSDEINKIWGHGNVIIGELTWQSAAYTARYMLKKAKGVAADDLRSLGLEVEQSRMSRRPGIGQQYFADHQQDIYPNDRIILPGGKKVIPPAYFDRLLKEQDEPLLKDVKNERQTKAFAASLQELEQSSYRLGDLLDNKAAALEQRLKKLPRHIDM